MVALLDIVGGTLGVLLFVNVFRLLAGVRFGSWRHVIAAYLAGAIAATFISAVGMADGGPATFQAAPVYWIGAAVAATLEIALIYRRANVPRA